MQFYTYIVALHTLFIALLIAADCLTVGKPADYISPALFILPLLFKYWMLGLLGTWVRISVESKEQKNPRPFTTGDFNHSSNQLKVLISYLLTTYLYARK